MKQLTHRIFGESYMPQTILKLSQKSRDLADGDARHIEHLAYVNMEFSKLCADVKKGHLTDPTTIISDALALDVKMVSWALSLPYEWVYTTIDNPSDRESRKFNSEFGPFGTHHHLYKDLICCSSWNNWRAARLLLHEIILNNADLLEMQSQTPGHNLELSRVAERTKAIMHEVIADICATVPYHFGALDDGSISEGYNATSAGHALLWPLFLAADCPVSSQEVKQWVIMCLGKIGHGMGINQALAMAKLLNDGLSPRTWIRPESYVEAEILVKLATAGTSCL